MTFVCNRNFEMKKFSLNYFLLIALLIFSVGKKSVAQNSGQQTFLSLTLPTSSHIAAVGGQDLASWNKESASFLQNPATLDLRSTNSFFLNYAPYIAGINTTAFGFSHSFHKLGNFGFGMQYLDYGVFEKTDETGFDLGKSFFGKDFSSVVGYSNKLTEHINYGVSAKYIYSAFESYSAAAIALDAGLIFEDTTSAISAGLCLKNAGTVFNDFTSNSESKLPFDLQAGINKQLKHTPFTLCLNLHDLTKFDIRYPENTQDILVIDSTDYKEKKYVADKVLRHCNFAIQINAGKNLEMNVGYNHQRRKELEYDIRKSLSGFSFGFRLLVKKINLGYSYSIFNISGGQSNLSLSFHLPDFVSVRKM